MECVTITITHTGSGSDAVIAFRSSMVDSVFAEGSQLWDGVMTDNTYLETIAIPATLTYLNPKWKELYGRDMLQSDICGYEGTVTGGTNIIMIVILLAIIWFFFIRRKF